MKKPLILAALIGVAAVSFPLSNLMHQPSAESQAVLAQIKDPHLKKAAPILQNKCLDCHSSQTRMPFYANFPIARDLIGKDIEEGSEHFNMSGKFANDGAGFTELDLARLEGVLNTQSMPPLRYVALHWNAGLSQQDSEDLRSWIHNLRGQRRQTVGIHSNFAGDAVEPLPLVTVLDANKVALGRKLFHDKRLSGDNTLSCASCHDLKKGGTDRSKTATGIRGQIGPINVPTVFNAGNNIKQFWDGRAGTLEEQAGGPVNNPMEMGANWKLVIDRLNKDPEMVNTFHRLYPDGITSANIVSAIATFERSLVTTNSKLDQYLRGNKTALSASEARGYELFKANCASCHAGKNLGGLSFEKMGRKADYFAARDGKITEVDYGLYNFTKKEQDKFKFKVPTLRNIAQTAPYFHDGSAETLEEAVRVMGQYQVGKHFSEKDVNDITAFLKTLTGEYEGKPVE
ncbi:MAG: cytochrome c peroxidase [Vampirovibrio sp.]|jgi:cytochrome c peroxidase|nr:cytochrome c peroxidase [Vampirovibrio sp.]